jgi:hypothetical protein
VVRRFDFEERKLGNFESMPMHWRAVQAEGFPRYTGIALDDAQSVSPGYSLKLQLNGGSAGVWLGPGVLPVIPGAQYLLTAQVRTAAALHSRVRIAAVFLDQRNQVIQTTLVASPLLISNEQWTAVELMVGQAPPDAAWLMLRLDLLQPSQFRRPDSGHHAMDLTDLYAAAWFDDVIVHQIPFAELRSQSDVNVVRAPDKPRLEARIIDFSGLPIDMSIDVRDMAGRTVDRLDKTLHPGHPGRMSWQPRLPGFGWYSCQLTISNGGQIIGDSLVAFSWLPPVQSLALPDLDRFMLAADDLPLEQKPLLEELLERIPGQAVSLTLWRALMTHDQLVNQSSQFDPLIGKLLSRRRSVVLAFAQTPQELALAARTDADAPLDLLVSDPKIWQPHLDPLLVRYGNQVGRWQIGRAGVWPVTQGADLAASVAQALGHFERYAHQPRLIVPWPATRQLPAALPPGALQLVIPSALRPEQILNHRLPADASGTELHYHLQPLQAGDFSHADRAVDLAMRVIYAWRHEPRLVSVHRPWSQFPQTPTMLLPDPLLGVWVHVAERLAGRRYVGDMRVAPGVECQMFDGPRGGVIVAWNRAASPDAARINQFLGDQPVVHDLMGNASQPTTVDGRHQIALSPSPVFIEGVDLRMARLRSSFRFEPEFISSVHAIHRTQLVFHNPWSRAVTGQLRLTGAERWDIQPRLINFSVPPGQDLKVPLEVSFPINELAGFKSIAAHMELDADRLYHLDLAAGLTIGLPDVEVEPTIAVEPNPQGSNDVVVTLATTNRGATDQSFYAFAAAPQQPRVERIIASLKQDQASVKRFRFPFTPELAGKAIRVGLRQTNGPAILNYELIVP